MKILRITDKFDNKYLQTGKSQWTCKLSKNSAIVVTVKT